MRPGSRLETDLDPLYEHWLHGDLRTLAAGIAAHGRGSSIATTAMARGFRAPRKAPFGVTFQARVDPPDAPVVDRVGFAVRRKAQRVNEIKVSSQHGGWLSHYFHFLIDFAHPFHDWYAESGLLRAEEPLDVNLEIRGEKDHLHEMAQRFEQLYPNVTLREVPSKAFARLDCKAVTTLGWKARGRSFDPASVANFGRHHVERAGGGSASGAEVVFIDRGVESKATGRKNGAQRRNISNSDALARRLEDEFGDGFVRAVLEHMSIAEQIRLFRDSRCFVGAHGAGFANIIFSERRPASMIEVFNREPGEKQHFITLAAARGVHHAYVQIPEYDAPVDVEVLVALVKSSLA